MLINTSDTDPTEQLYSHGSSSVIDSLHTLSKDYKSPMFDIFLINCATLLRNNVEKDKSNDKIVEGTFEDMDNIILALHEYLFSRPVPPKAPIVCIYLPDYKALPILHRRELNKSNLHINELLRLLIKKYIKDPSKPELSTFRDIQCVTMIAGTDRLFPHQHIYQYLQELTTKGAMSHIKHYLGFNSLKIGMLSHSAIDLHLGRYVKNFYLLESYTGYIKTLEKFGEKVFKIPAIPLNSVTHLTFGDSNFVRPIAMRKTKKLLVEMAIANRWYTKTEAGILDDIVRSGFIPKNLLTHVKF